jgi:hypothetical protein
MGVILLTEGLPQEPDFGDQGDLWRGQKARERRLNGALEDQGDHL